MNFNSSFRLGLLVAGVAAYSMINATATENQPVSLPSSNITTAAVNASQTDEPSKVLVWDRNEDGSRYYRIPAIETAADGSLVAVCDKRGSSINDLPNTISVVCKRSTDGGKTWSEAVTIAEGNKSEGTTYGDPAIVLDRNTGKLICVYSGDTGFFVSTRYNRAGFYVSESSDNGKTWTAPRAITDQLYQSNWYGSFCASGKMLQTSDGKIMFVANTRTSSAQSVTDVYEFVCCSEDGGQNWKVLNADSRIPAAGNGNESKLVELPNGDLLMSIRSTGARRFSKSTDGGKTWSAAVAANQLVEPGCNGDIIAYPSTDGQSRLIQCVPNNSSTRRDVTIFMSYDNGETWPVKKLLVNDYSAYASLTVLEDGSIGCLAEVGNNDFQLYFYNFTLDWLTDGNDTPSTDLSDIYDGTLNCDGSRYMTIPHSKAFDIAAGGQLTVSVKVRLDSYGSHRGIICNRSHSATYSNAGNGSTTGFDIFGGNSASQSMSNNVNLNKGSWNNIGHSWCNTIETKKWQTITWVFDGSNHSSKLYIDDKMVNEVNNASKIDSYPINPQKDILVGARYDLNSYPCNVWAGSMWLGNIDDVRFFSKALSEEEVKANLTATVNAETADLIAAYDFAEVKGLTVTDISGNGHNATLVGFPENAEGCTVTIATPSHGSLKVFNGENELFSGRKVKAGTELTVEATPDGGFMLSEITVNGKAVEGNTFVAQENSTVSATFVRDPSVPVSYVEPNGDGKSDKNCYLESISTENALENIEITHTQKNGVNYELCDEQTIVVNPGCKFNIHFVGKKANNNAYQQPTGGLQDFRYCVAYIFTDWDCDGTFEQEIPAEEKYQARGCYGFFSGDALFEGNIAANFNHVLDITHTFTVPENAVEGLSRIRVIYTEAWDGTASGGGMNGNYQKINKGYAYDFLVNCDKAAAISDITAEENNAPTEYYNLQGVRVSTENLTPGLYIVRQGKTAKKVLITK